MKKTILFLSALGILACKNEPKDYVLFTGKIIDKNSDSIVISNRDYTKTIKVNEDGTFSDTLKVADGKYSFYDGGESTTLFLKNGYELNMNLDAKMFDETISYTGIGSETNNYLAKKALMQETIYPPSLFDFEEPEFKSKISDINASLSDFLESNKAIDTALYASERSEINQFMDEMLGYYSKQKEYEAKRAAEFADLNGIPSPTFVNYENYKGGTSSLSDFKGKYVYVDVWATWCGPCKAEIPSLKEIEKNYHGKNIEFVSISVDNGRGYTEKTVEASKEGWKKMIAEKEMGGTQLFADKAWESDFTRGFKVNSIPRFILIGPDGTVVHPDAPRPSSPKLTQLFNSLEL